MAKFLIVEARFYDHLNDMLIAGATEALKAAGHEHEVLTVPGALEIPGAISLAIDSDLYDGFVAIGVVIRGETYHFEIVAGESARGLMALSMDGAEIGENAFVAAMAFVKAGFVVPPRSLVAGLPARVVRELSPAELAWKVEATRGYQDLAARCLASMTETDALGAPEPGRGPPRGLDHGGARGPTASEKS